MPVPAPRYSERDMAMMQRCLDLAARARGLTSPNPMVGAVVARDGRVVAEAWHTRAGRPHAEALALHRAGARARGATLYSNLEPCAHFGRTPPCVDAIVAAGIRKVVAAHIDPFSKVRGRGFAALRRSGVRVAVGLLAPQARSLNEAYLTAITRGRPLVIVKAAMTLDGRIATARGASRWISGAVSRRLVHMWRAQSDAIMVGARTVAADNPRLTARGRLGRQPQRIVVDAKLRIDPGCRMLSGRRGGQVIIYTVRGVSRSRRAALERVGAQVRCVPAGRGGVSLRAVMTDLAAHRVTQVLIEGGGELIASALHAGVVDRVALFAAPLLLGGHRAVPLVGGRDARSLRHAIRLDGMTCRPSGTDLLIEARVVRS